ncbi:MAG: hypothetical protein C4335_13015 [Armatimonadota bacterium]
MIKAYLDEIRRQLHLVEQTQKEAMERAAQAMADAIQNDHLIYVFGATHAGILAQELFYRAGGLACVSPILPPGLTCDVRPITMTSVLERHSGYAQIFMSEVPLEAGDVLIVHSVSGRNAVAVEVAQYGREKGALVIALTSLTYSKSVAPRAGTKRLFEVADIVLDNCGVVGDAVVEIPGMRQKVAPTSTVIGAAMLNALVAQTVAILQERGVEPPVFLSANLDGGDAHNARLLERYRGRVLYL